MPSRFLYELGAEVPREEPSEYKQEYLEDYSQHYDEPVINTAPGKKPAFGTNQLVSHKVFGLGRVQKFVDMGENSVVTVRFNSGQTKTLMVKYANLDKM
jgi:hypothetical protein